MKTTQSSLPSIKIITGSVRPGRFNTQPSEWAYQHAQKQTNMQVELLDLSQIKLPFLDEPATPMSAQYTKKHTHQWSEAIKQADGFVFVTPEYNHSYSPVLKNAIDFLFYEWHYKPVAFISYGSAAGGSRAVEHLRAVVAEIKMYDLREQVLLPNYWGGLDETGRYSFTPQQEESLQELLSAVAFWAGVMKPAREKLQSA